MEKIPQYYTEEQVAQMTCISKKTLQQHRWLKKGIAYSRLGRSIRYEHSDILNFMGGNRIEAEAV